MCERGSQGAESTCDSRGGTRRTQVSGAAKWMGGTSRDFNFVLDLATKRVPLSSLANDKTFIIIFGSQIEIFGSQEAIDKCIL